MISDFYLSRTLYSDKKTYSEAALLAASRFIVILAEPGAGKTRLMESLARQLDTLPVTANRFVHTNAQNNGSPLLLDAYDELAKINASGIYKMLEAALAASPTNLVISSRSSEWDNAANSAFNEFFGASPLVARLSEFAQDEQQKIFENHRPKEEFSAFQAEVARFDLEILLPNPQFLKLFADAYVESGRKFTNKRSIFSLALERLAKEANASVKNTVGSLSPLGKVDAASEVFAKLLLSGAEGVTTSEASEDALYPLLGSLVKDASSINSILSTRMFKPGDTVDTHRPAHKIIAEYAAARYLTKRISDAADPLILERCLPIIAPNATTRDELRGLLGWMASLGNKSIQKAAIELDPYAVLANGDPSQLDATSKRLLVERLKDNEEKDPYFRRGDFWRRFSVTGFFTPEVLGEIKPLLSQEAEGHLRVLILELLDGSPAIQHLSDELRTLLLDPQVRENTRLLALNCLLGQEESYIQQSDIDNLVSEASLTSLKLVAKTIEKLGPKTFSYHYLLNYFRVCTHLYPGHKEWFGGIFGARYFVKRLVSKLELPTIEKLINGLTNSMTCTCGKKNYECDCRTGTSKIIGALLDRYFELSAPPHDPVQVWKWVQNLNYHDTKSANQSKAVELLQADRDLRQGIIKHMLGRLTDKDEIYRTKFHLLNMNAHSGLNLFQEDYEFIVEHAYNSENPALWAAFMAHHQIYRRKAERGPDKLRRRMREQALNKPAFMQEWVRSNRDAARQKMEDRILIVRHSRRMKRRRILKNKTHAANIKYVHENRVLVEGGRHWKCLVQFAKLVLQRPEKIEEEFGDEIIVRNSLRNCLDFISPHVPNLAKLAELQCASQYQESQVILYAACLELLRRNNNLTTVPIHLLWALRTNLDIRFNGVQDSEREALKDEVNRLALSTDKEAEQFCRQYIEPQLRDLQCSQPQVDWLRNDPVFRPLAPSLAYEWLRDFELMPVSALDTLFEIVAQYGEQEELKELIAYRSSEMLLFYSPELSPKGLEERRAFWFIRAIYFLEGSTDPYWDWLKSDKENVFLFNERSGKMNRSDYPTWPSLTSDKVEAILDAFFPHWPKVPLPSSWGTGSPKGETAYRFLTDVIWSINADDPDMAIPSLKRLLNNSNYADLHKDMKSMLAELKRKKALIDFKPPSPREIVALLDEGEVVTVEGLRQLVLLELSKLQEDINGGEFNTVEMFYNGQRPLQEVACTRIIAERLNLILKEKNITVTPEHHLKNDKRCDFTTAKMLDGKRRLVVTEVKGQWHRELYEAASDQLSNRYAIHPDAEQQGIYLVIWFGADENVAGSNTHGLSGAEELRQNLESGLSDDLKGLIDVFVLDVSK